MKCLICQGLLELGSNTSADGTTCTNGRCAQVLDEIGARVRHQHELAHAKELRILALIRQTLAELGR